MLRAALIACLPIGPALGCETALVLSIDVSGSIDGGDYRLQTEGLAAALSDPEVAEALVRGQVALSVIQWSGIDQQAVVLPWQRMLTPEAVIRFADSAAAIPRAFYGSDTAVGQGLRFATAQFAAVADCGRKVIDISGDGQENAGFTDSAARAEAMDQGLMINAIAIEEPGPAQAMRLIGTPDAPLLIDVRIEEDIAALPRLIPTARRIPHTDIATLTDPPGRAITVCTKGRKLSEGAAAWLRTLGWQAEVLEGGTLAWEAAGLPSIPLSILPEPGTPWVTRHRPKIDRIACPWLIRRFIDPKARFLFVAPAEVPDVASRFDAVPYDIEGVPFSHRGEQCSFDALLDDFGLHCEALDRMALVIRAADTDRHDLAPQAAGLLALSVGLSRMYREDLQQLEAGIALYDALYRWARDGHEEGHDWPAGRPE